MYLFEFHFRVIHSFHMKSRDLLVLRMSAYADHGKVIDARRPYFKS